MTFITNSAAMPVTSLILWALASSEFSHNSVTTLENSTDLSTIYMKTLYFILYSIGCSSKYLRVANPLWHWFFWVISLSQVKVTYGAIQWSSSSVRLSSAGLQKWFVSATLCEVAYHYMLSRRILQRDFSLLQFESGRHTLHSLSRS
jgi:hypothetical protein